MSNFKVPHDEFGNHCPVESESTAVYTDPYELKEVTLVFAGIEEHRNATHVVWKHYYTGKRYRSSVYLLTDAASDKLDGEATVLFMKRTGLFITGSFGFEQRGNDVLLAVLQPESKPGDKDVALDYATQVFQRVADGKLSLREVKTEARLFLEYLKEKEDE